MDFLRPQSSDRYLCEYGGRWLSLPWGEEACGPGLGEINPQNENDPPGNILLWVSYLPLPCLTLLSEIGVRTCLWEWWCGSDPVEHWRVSAEWPRLLLVVDLRSLDRRGHNTQAPLERGWGSWCLLAAPVTVCMASPLRLFLVSRVSKVHTRKCGGI